MKTWIPVLFLVGASSLLSRHWVLEGLQSRWYLDASRSLSGVIPPSWFFGVV